MKSFISFLIAGVLYCAPTFARNDEPVNTSQLGFRENKGQLIDQHNNKRNDIIYYGSSNGMGYYLKKDGLSYQLYEKADKSDEVTIQRVDIKWLGTNANAATEAGRAVGGYENFYNTPDGKELLNVKAFETVLYKNIYAGIDAKYYHQNGSLKYDYIVKPHADYKKIAFRIEGADKITLNEDGTITIKTPLGNITEGKPITYQEGKEIKADWVLENGVLSFSVAQYDAAKELVIDPLAYAWTKLYGWVILGNMSSGSIVDLYNCDINSMGDLFITEIDRIAGYPPSPNPIHNGLWKYNTTTQSQNGGNQSATFPPYRSVSVDGMTPYVAGSTSVQNIATIGAYQTVLAGANDLFLRKLNTNGSNALWTTYYGGAGDETGGICVVDKSGGVYLTGSTTSAANISTPLSYQSLYADNSDCFIVRFDTNGIRQWATYLGGIGRDTINTCAATNNMLVIGGLTGSHTNITTANAFQPNFSGGQYNSFVSTFDSSGNLIWSTYYGDSSTSIAKCAMDNHGKHILFCGKTKATAAIASPTAHQSALGGGTDGYLVKLDSTGARLWGTYYGGALNDDATTLAVHDTGYYICGNTASANNISTPLAYQESVFSGATNTYIASFDTGGHRKYGTYYNAASINDCVVNSAGDLFLIGDNSDISNGTAHISKFSNCNPQHTIVTSSTSFCRGTSVQLSTTYSSTSYKWYRNDVLINNISNDSVLTTSTVGTYKLMVDGCPIFSNTITLTQLTPPLSHITKKDIFCYENNASGIISNQVTSGMTPYSYTWSSLNNNIVTLLPFTTPSIQNLNAGKYICLVTDVNGCMDTDTTTIIQKTTTPPSSPLAEICAVTVDSATGKNLVIWEKQGDVRAASYNIYTEGNVAGQYNLINTSAVGQFSTYLDNNSNPQQQSYLYKISETDSCNHENPLSVAHKTIHLAANTGINGQINLSWNQYEGRPYSSHYIMRSHNFGPYELLNQVSSGITSYSDLTPPVGVKLYRIDIDLPTTCSPSKLTSVTRVSSNNVRLIDKSYVQIVPNPTTDVITIIGTKPHVIRVFDAIGKLLMEQKDADQLQMKGLPSAIYLIKLYDENGQVYHQQKIVKE